MTATKRLTVLAMLTAAGLVLFVFESLIPVLPWFRPGLGNIATILALLYYGPYDAFKTTLLRIVLGSLVLGRLMTPIFLVVLAGGIASLVIMAMVNRYAGRWFSPVGISVLGAVAHNVVQLATAYLFFVRSAELFIFLSLFIGTGVITGILTGLISSVIYRSTEGRLGFELSDANSYRDHAEST